MKALFDTSVLFAAMNSHHLQHHLALPWALQVMYGEMAGYISSHTLAETYSIWTRHPELKIPPRECQHSLAIIQGHFTVISLDVTDYNAVIQSGSELNLVGGSIYDALHAQAARKENVDMLLTFNSKHFVRLGQDIAERVHVPS